MSTPDGKDAVEEAAEKVKDAAEKIDPKTVSTVMRVGVSVFMMSAGFALVGSGARDFWTNYKGKGWPKGSSS